MGMHIRVEKAADGTYIVEVPSKPKKDNNGHPECIEDLKYTAKTEKETLRIIGEALKEIPNAEDEYGIAFDRAVKPTEG